MALRSIGIIELSGQFLNQSPHLADLLHHAGIVLLQGPLGLQSDRKLQVYDLGLFEKKRLSDPGLGPFVLIGVRCCLAPIRPALMSLLAQVLQTSKVFQMRVDFGHLSTLGSSGQ